MRGWTRETVETLDWPVESYRAAQLVIIQKRTFYERKSLFFLLITTKHRIFALQ